MKKESTIDSKINKLKLINYIAVEMNRKHTVKSLFELILERCLDLTGAKTGSVMLINKKKGVLDIIASKGIKEEVVSKTKLKLGEGITGWVAQTGDPKLVNNTRQDPLYIKVKEDLLSELAVPIKTLNNVIGVVSVDSNKEDSFNQDDLEMLTMVSELGAQILGRQDMTDRLESKIRSQEVLIDSIEIIERETEPKAIFNSVIELLAAKMGIIRGMLVLFDSGKSDSLKVIAGYRLSSDAMQKGIYKIGEGIVGTAVLTGQTISVEDVANDPLFLNKMQIKRSGMGQVSFIASPIKAGKRVLGVLAVEKQYETGENFPDTVNTLTLLTSLLSYRITNYQRQHEETQKLLEENIELRKELNTQFSFKQIIGKDDKIRKIIEQVKTVSNTQAPVLITGETGTGKELIAKILHFLSDRRAGKFISVNCAAIPENLLESELFGFEKGAFTGASSSKKGKFELADGGTLFLDEIGEMAVHLQSKILRAIQEKEIEPLGSEKTVKVDIRIITATNRDLKKRVETGHFRADLYFRLNVINIDLPPLRERRGDIFLLADFFIKKFNEVYSKQVTGISSEVKTIFESYNWPGNIRELENVIERAVIMSVSPLIDLSLLPDGLNPEKSGEKAFGIKEYIKAEVAVSGVDEIYSKVLGKLEKELIGEIMINTDNNKSQAAKMLGINRNTLKAKLKEYKIL